ncbi:MAG: flagellar hook protein FlgE [gamma proteobacterium symbiont of Taylorina sp.]|nr:flagellar hook protein FlgE [gamma proteobacterium symbiont of Taylorina sp.]
MPFRIGLSGLNAAQADLKVTGNNIANTGTIGFKQSRAEFADVYATSKQGSVATAIGSGVRLAATSQQFTQGNLIFTENNLDLGITGDGFFSMRDTAGSSVYTRNGQFKIDSEGYVVDNSGSKLQGYGIDPNTNEINTGIIDDLQVIATNIAPKPTSETSIVANIDAGEAVPIIPFSMDKYGTVDPTSYNHTTSYTSFDSLGNPMQTSLFFRKIDESTWDVGIKQVDANGNIFQNLDTSYKTTDPSYDVTAIPQIIYTPNVNGTDEAGAVGIASSAIDGAGIIKSAALDGGATEVEAQAIYDAYLGADATPGPASGYLGNYTTPALYPDVTSNSDANTAAITDAAAAAATIDTANGTSSPDPNSLEDAVNAVSARAEQAASTPAETITFLNNGTIDPNTVGAGLGKFDFTFNMSNIDFITLNGVAGANVFTLNNPVMRADGGDLISQSLSTDLTKLTQYGADFGITNLIQDGYTTGQLAGIEIDQSGIVLARFTNGESNNLGQIFLTNFTNNQGLSQLGNNYWTESFSSGQGVINVPGSGSAGLINSGAVEDSNVDLTAQLINLITAQRNFQANAKTITTANQVTQTLLQI